MATWKSAALSSRFRLCALGFRSSCASVPSSVSLGLSCCPQAGLRASVWPAAGGRGEEFRDSWWGVLGSWDVGHGLILHPSSVILATLMILSTVDGRMAHVQGSYTGYLGIWPNCGRHRCANLDQVTVLAHMSTGFMMLALSLSVILLLAMCLSLRPVFWCLNKVDLVFSSLSFITGFLIVLSMALFVIQCETLRPKPQVSYLPITYLCWGAGALMLWAGILSYLNYMGICSKVRFFMERRMSYRRWVSQRGALRSASQQQSEPDTKHTVHLPSSLTLPGTPPDSQDTNQKPRLGAGPAPFIVAVRPLDLP
ncbi:uncharacterized protein [Manis javanica]|uniref:uncharacterized protein isoform X1 n=2 Tax=Manis javanica TaxID=9974 RepID=UPI003C6DB6BB